MNYEKKYKEAKRLYGEGKINESLSYVFPELKDNDAMIRRNIIAAIKGEGYYDCDLTKECIAWVEKHGEQKTTAWSDHDEENLQHSTAAIMAADYYTLEDKEELCQWVESLKERVQPQTQQLETED